MSASRLTARAALSLSALVMARAANGHCFIVRDAAGTLVQQTTKTPVDLSLPLEDAVPKRFGRGAHLIFSTDDKFRYSG